MPLGFVTHVGHDCMFKVNKSFVVIDKKMVGETGFQINDLSVFVISIKKDIFKTLKLTKINCSRIFERITNFITSLKWTLFANFNSTNQIFNVNSFLGFFS